MAPNTRRRRPPKRFRRSLARPVLWLMLIAAVVWVRLHTRSAPSPAPEAIAEGDYRVRYVIDGDTFVLANNARVRLQGIDTPEAARDGLPAEPWSAEATTFTRRFVDDADRTVRLTFGAERTDHYGRHLAFAWHGDTMLNEQLVRAGLARARPDYRFSGKMKGRLLAAQREAQAARVGLWSAD